MKSSNFWARALAFAAVALLVATGANAQLQTGNLYGNVHDQSGAALPGVTVTLSGQGAPQIQVTNAQGQFRFLSLSPGSYAIKAELEGFSTVDYPNIVVNVGRNTTIEVKLQSAVEETITVTAESPLLDERRIAQGATVSKTELEKIPTARDPWAVLQTTPGVLTDRINVGGNESGQQSNYVGPGVGGDQAVWAVDGVVITDMAALGSSPAYYDFDAFEEMQVSTGGSDTTQATPGVTLNMVTKRGTNEWRGSGRYYEADDSWQSNTGLNTSDLGNAGPWGPTADQTTFKQGNRIVKTQDYGAEVGGPIVKDRLWIWGSYGENKVHLLTIADVSDKTTLKSTNAKLNAQIVASNSATAFYFNSEKVKIGRNAGPTRPQETTWDQGHFGDKPTTWKIEDTQIFSSNFYLTGMYSKVNGGFELVPEGGTTATTYLDENFIWHNNFLLYQTPRPQDQVKADASSFFNTGSLSHELKFGAGYRKATVESLSHWPGAGIVYNGPGVFGTPTNWIGLARDAHYKTEQKYTSAYLQDTLTSGNLTVNAGVRYDKQTGSNLTTSAPANPVDPVDLPAVTVQGYDAGFTWESVTPRIGLTYALGADRKTLLRASYSRFADQLGTGTIAYANPLGLNGYAYAYTSNQGTPIFTPGQIISPVYFYSSNVNPFTGGLLVSNGVSTHLTAPKTDELLFSVEHALLPEFVVGLNLTFRKTSDLLGSDLLVFNGDPYSATNVNQIGRRATRADYVQCGTAGYPACPTGVLPNGQTYTITNFYVLNHSLETRNGGYLFNTDNEQEYKGASLTFNKRLANRWMLRGNVTWNDWTWSKVDNSDPSHYLGGGGEEGDQVLQGSGTGSGSKGGVYINSRWAYSVNGLYQVAPDRAWGFNLAANLTGREGYPVPYFRRIQLGTSTSPNYVTSPTVNLQATNRPDSVRLDNITDLDLRIEKEFHFSDFGLTIGADCFNVFNEATVLQRVHRLNRGNSDYVQEIMSPRIFRLGARFSFR